MTHSRRPVTFVDTVESVAKAAAERGLERRKEVKKAVGPRKLGEQRVTPDQKAMLHLPLWEGPGQAADYDEQGNPLGRGYWLEMYQRLGAKGMLQHDREMRRLHETKSPLWQQYLTPMQQEQLADWRARGLHTGQPRPPLATETPQPLGQGALRTQARRALPATQEQSSTPLPVAGSEAV